MNQNGNTVLGGAFQSSDVFTSSALNSGAGDVGIVSANDVASPALP